MIMDGTFMLWQVRNLQAHCSMHHSRMRQQPSAVCMRPAVFAVAAITVHTRSHLTLLPACHADDRGLCCFILPASQLGHVYAGELSKNKGLVAKQKKRRGSGCKLRRTLSWKGSKLRQKLSAVRRLRKRKRLG